MRYSLFRPYTKSLAETAQYSEILLVCVIVYGERVILSTRLKRIGGHDPLSKFLGRGACENGLVRGQTDGRKGVRRLGEDEGVN